jgi:DNA-binding IclR family transcriptional regulator
VQTVDKALSLLSYFSEQRPSVGLSELARLSGFNKATTRRFLVALEKHGIVEQDATTRLYRFSLYAGGSLATIGLSESAKSSRVMLGKGEAIPLHATASGLAYLAFARPVITDRVLSKALPAFTEHTVTGAEKIRRQLSSVRKQGVAVAKNTFEDGVCGIAAPVFDSDGFACGTVAIAAPAARAQRKVIASVQPEVMRAANEISLAMGAEPRSGQAVRNVTAAD